jgi:radical SAM superfamily enzyme YgiQ (UPF0313 family)
MVTLNQRAERKGGKSLKSQLIVEKNKSIFSVEAESIYFSLYKFFLQKDTSAKLCADIVSFIESLHSQDVLIVDEIGQKFFESIINLSDLNCKITCLEAWQLNKSELKSNLKPDKQFVYYNFMSRFSDRIFVQNFLEEENISSFLVEETKGLDLTKFPKHCWVSKPNSIYPLNLPSLEVDSNLDLLVVDPPARNLALLPNGIAYLEVALNKSGAKFQILDLDILAYHLFHMHRIFDIGEDIQLNDGTMASTDPWLAHNYDSWSSLSEHDSALSGKMPIHDFFEFLLVKAKKEIVKANPKFLGLSVQQCNEVSGGLLVDLLKKDMPQLKVIVGGFSCYNADIGLRGVPFADYMCIGEADLTIGDLITRLIKGEQPRNLPGILSKSDDPNRLFSPAPMIHDLDKIEFPKYSWTNLNVYKNWDGYALIPIIASRGCRWSRCTFCAERFYWRIRSAENFVDELEWLVEQGSYLFMFNESDLNGMPERVLEICDEIIKRGLNHKIKLTGQLRIHRKSDKAFFNKLKEAGFVALRFGVDSFSSNGLRMQQKGYTKAIVAQNLKDCFEAGIYIEVNWVIGVPGETENDISEGIDFILENKEYIGRLANLNPLIMVNGSVYWMNPDEFKIKFKEDREYLYKKYPRAIPAAQWWSEDPFIDASVRQKWFHKVVTKLYEEGFPIGDWALQVINDVENQKDSMRNGTTNESSDTRNESIDLQKDFEIELTPAFAQAPDEAKTELKFIKKFNGYGIYELSSSYVAIHDAQVDLGASAAQMFRSGSVMEVELLIDQSIAWANTRGTYKNSSQKHEAALRVDSGLIAFNNLSGSHLKSSDVIWKDQNKNYFAFDSSTTFLKKLEKKRKPSNFKTFAFFEFVNKIFKKAIDVNSTLTRSKKESIKIQIDFFEEVKVLQIVTVGAVPELISSWNEYKINIVKFDNKFYVLNHGEDVQFLGDAYFSENLLQFADIKELFATLGIEFNRIVRSSVPVTANQRKSAPLLVRKIGNFKIVEYEGFYHAIPDFLGEIDLKIVDVMQVAEIFRDVSLSAVEDYALEQIELLEAK